MILFITTAVKTSNPTPSDFFGLAEHRETAWLTCPYIPH
jgi:hypothetical protein